MFGVDRSLAMGSPPNTQIIIGDTLRLDDVNGDGLDDLLQVTTNNVHIWLNVDGASFTNEHVINNAPNSPGYADLVRLTDINGSGTRDILYGKGLKYQYMDLAGGVQPWTLVHVDNGLGKTTDLDYTPSTTLMLAAEKAGNPWTSKAPMVMHVVTRSVEHDNLAAIGRPEGDYTTFYEYQDPYYDGRQREFRGFRTARAIRAGDANSPTATTSTTFALGECKDETPKNNIDECSLSERWRDNPREALKGLPITSESYDASKVYLSTSHHTYRLRQLYMGLDGRAVRHAFESASDNYAYDTGPFQSGLQTITLTGVELEGTLGTVTTDTSDSVAVRSTHRAHLTGDTQVDIFGNATSSTSHGCVDGCAQVDESITSTTTPARRNDDPTGWMWRTTEGYTTGSLQPAKRHHQFIEYDLFGNPTKTTAELMGTLALHRFHESNKTVAPAPTAASVDSTITLSAICTMDSETSRGRQLRTGAAARWSTTARSLNCLPAKRYTSEHCPVIVAAPPWSRMRAMTADRGSSPTSSICTTSTRTSTTTGSVGSLICTSPIRSRRRA